MTLPSPNNPSGGSVTTLPDGTPNFPASVVISGSTSIWNMPSALEGKTIWYDTKRSEADEQVLDMRTHRTRNIKSQSSSQVLRTPDAIFKQFAAMSFNDPQKYLALQRALASGPWGTVNPTGAFDADTEKALGNALLQYHKLTEGAGVGVSFSDYLIQTGERAQALGGKGTSLGSGTGRAPQVLQVTDPEQIRAAAMQAFQDATGAGASEQQLNAFVAKFQSLQTQAQTATSGTVSAPDLTAQAMAYAQQQDPSAYHANQRDSFVNALVNMFAPSGSQRPNITPTPTVGG